MNMRLIVELVQETFRQWREEDITRMGAALAYFAAFSIIPLLLLVATLAGLVWGEEQVELQVAQSLREFIGEPVTQTVQDILRTVYADQGINSLTTLVSVLAFLYGATGFFRHLKNTLNVVWNVTKTEENKVEGFFKDTVLSFIMVLGTSLGLFLILALNTGLFTYVRSLDTLYPDVALITLWQILGFIMLAGSTAISFAIIYKALPDAHVTWRDVWVGAVISALLLTASQFVLSFFVNASSLETIYGAASIFMFLLIWVYFSVHVMLIGAEFTQVYANRAGSKIVPRAEDDTQ